MNLTKKSNLKVIMAKAAGILGMTIFSWTFFWTCTESRYAQGLPNWGFRIAAIIALWGTVQSIRAICGSNL